MAETTAQDQPFNVAIVGQGGRLQYEAILAASLAGDVAPASGVAFWWPSRSRGRSGAAIRDQRRDIRARSAELGAEILPFESRHFGAMLPLRQQDRGALRPARRRALRLFDTDTLITGEIPRVPFDFDRPTASLRRSGTWPAPELYGPGYTAIWKSLYDRFGLDFESSLDPKQPR